ncbi:uncharacterized protein [Miscanthus floridulus]|uniref:uncharacterized protein n=1 Tax=Miscanthus floridulus TaxID=154761 RepID=UPI003457D1C5
MARSSRRWAPATQQPTPPTATSGPGAAVVSESNADGSAAPSWSSPPSKPGPATVATSCSSPSPSPPTAPPGAAAAASTPGSAAVVAPGTRVDVGSDGHESRPPPVASGTDVVRLEDGEPFTLLSLTATEAPAEPCSPPPQQPVPASAIAAQRTEAGAGASAAPAASDLEAFLLHLSIPALSPSSTLSPEAAPFHPGGSAVGRSKARRWADDDDLLDDSDAEAMPTTSMTPYLDAVHRKP